MKGKVTNITIVNRKARFNYHIQETFEAGIVLQGSEIKSLRDGRGNIIEAYATEKNGEIFLLNSYIPEYKSSSFTNHAVRRARKLLLQKRQIKKMIGIVANKGLTLVPLKLYSNKRGFVKIEIGVGKGKKLYDKREDKKRKDWIREKSRLLKITNKKENKK